MGLSFSAKFVSRCANGHSVKQGDYIAYDDDNNILCTKCPEFENRTRHKELIYSNKFCKKCNLELPMTGICGECDA